MADQDDKYEGQFRDAHTPDAEEVKARRGRNRVLGLALAAFVILVGVITFIRLSSSDLSDGGFYYTYEDRAAEAGEQDLPPGMTKEQAAPPPNLTPSEAEQTEDPE